MIQLKNKTLTLKRLCPCVRMWKVLFTTCVLNTLTSTEECIKLLPSVKWFRYFRKNNLSRVSGQTLIYFHVTVLHYYYYHQTITFWPWHSSLYVWREKKRRSLRRVAWFGEKGRILVSLTKICMSFKLSADLPDQSLCHALVWSNWFKYVHCIMAVLKIHVRENLGNKCMQVSKREQKATTVLVLNCRGNCF